MACNYLKNLASKLSDKFLDHSGVSHMDDIRRCSRKWNRPTTDVDAALEMVAMVHRLLPNDTA